MELGLYPNPAASNWHLYPSGAGWQGRVTVSHAFAFAANLQEEIQALSQRYGKLGKGRQLAELYGRLPKNM